MVEAMVAANKKDELFRILRANANDRNTVEDWLRLGRASMKMGDSDTAQTALLTAARVDKGQNAEPQIALVDLYRQLGRTRDAEARLRMAYFRAPQSTAVIQRQREMGNTLKPGDGWLPTEASTEN
jgi:cytochrome c-type biogenesis protein CcmH/NrfG